jgi:phenylacetic acid degradation protein
LIYEYKGIKPVVHSTAFVHPQASVIGDVKIGKNVYVGSGASLRGDIGRIVVGDGSNIQENCILHMFPGKTVILGEKCHIGHGAIVHGAVLGSNCLVGMNSVVMDDVLLDEECIVGAMTFIPAEKTFAKRSLIVGNPAKKIKEVSDDMIGWKTEGTSLYQELCKESIETLKECSPLREEPKFKKNHSSDYQTWNSEKKK